MDFLSILGDILFIIFYEFLGKIIFIIIEGVGENYLKKNILYEIGFKYLLDFCFYVKKWYFGIN